MRLPDPVATASGALGIEISRNIVTDSTAGFLIGGGRSNTITDNVINACAERSVVIDSRGTGWARRSTGWLEKPDGTMWKRLNEVPYRTGAWHKRFPYLAAIENDAYGEPRHNTVSGNRLLATPEMELASTVRRPGTVKDKTEADAAE